MLIQKLKYICKKEKLKCSDKILNKIINICRGDLRKAINLLQTCYNSFGNELNEQLLDDISGIIPLDKFNKLMDYILNKDIKNVNNYIDKIILDGYSLVNQIIIFHNYIIDSKLTSEQKSNLLCKLVEIDQNLIKGCDEYIHFMKFAYHIMITI